MQVAANGVVQKIIDNQENGVFMIDGQFGRHVFTALDRPTDRRC